VFGLNRKREIEEREELIRDLTRMGRKGVNSLDQKSLADSVCKLLGIKSPKRHSTEDMERDR